MISALVSDEKILAYMETIHEISRDGNLIRDEYLEGEKWEKLEQQTLLRLQECPGDAFTIDALAHHYLNRNQYTEAITLYKQALRASSQPATIQHHLAFGYYHQGDLKRALEEFRKIDLEQLKREGNYYIDWHEFDYLDEEYYVEVIPPPLSDEEQFEEALQFTMKTLIHNANMYAKMCLYDFTIECYQELLQLMPKAPCVLNMLGVAFMGADKHREAKKAFSEAIRYNPGLEQAYLNLGITHSILQEYELAIGILKKASVRFPGNHETWLDLTLTYLKLNYQQKAIECLVKALQTEAEQHYDLKTITELQPILEIAHEKLMGKK
ncbi:MAG: tetratricopeptide repeat protein [Candidatus Heimdallarchaeota archaeon]